MAARPSSHASAIVRALVALTTVCCGRPAPQHVALASPTPVPPPTASVSATPPRESLLLVDDTFHRPPPTLHTFLERGYVTASCPQGTAVWSLETGKQAFVPVTPVEEQILMAEMETVEPLVDGRLLVRSKNAKVRVFSKDLQPLRALPYASFLVGEGLLGAGIADPEHVELYDLEHDEVIGSLPHRGALERVFFHPTESIAIVFTSAPGGGGEHRLTGRMVIDFSDRAHPRELRDLHAVGRSALTVRFAATGSVIAFDSDDRIDFWDAATKRRLGAALNRGWFALSPDGDRAVLVVEKSSRGDFLEAGQTLIVDTHTSKVLARLPITYQDTERHGVSWPRDGQTIWIALSDAAVARFRSEAGDSREPHFIGFDATTYAKKEKAPFDPIPAGFHWSTWAVEGKVAQFWYPDRPTELRRVGTSESVILAVHQTEKACSLLAFDNHQHFDGLPGGAVQLRYQDAPTTQVESGPDFEAHRLPGLVRRFLDASP